jgi:hypothetical protein
MNRRAQLVCAWSGIAFTVVFFVGFWIFAGFIPPPAPGGTAAQIASVYAHNRTGIRIGLVITMFASGLLCPWFAVISIQMQRIEGRRSVLAYTQMIAGAATVLEFILPPMIWQTAAYRPERAVQTVQTLTDLGWLPFLGIISTAIIQGYSIGWVILADKRLEPVFPRWVGYFQFWVLTLLVPGSLIVFFTHGPLAWNGVLAWWLVLAAYFMWIVITSVYLVRAIKREPVEETAYQGVADRRVDGQSRHVFGRDPLTEALAAEVAQLRSDLDRVTAESQV